MGGTQRKKARNLGCTGSSGTHCGSSHHIANQSIGRYDPIRFYGSRATHPQFAVRALLYTPQLPKIRRLYIPLKGDLDLFST